MAKSANVFKGRQFTAEVIRWPVRRSPQFSTKLGVLERMPADRNLDDGAVLRSAQRCGPEIEKWVWSDRRMTNGAWRADETCIRVKAQLNHRRRVFDKRRAMKRPRIVIPGTTAVDKNRADPSAAKSIMKPRALSPLARLRQVNVSNAANDVEAAPAVIASPLAV